MFIIQATNKFTSYFSAQYMLDKGCAFNLGCSDRSDGKTFDCAYRALINYAENKHQSIYMRRYKTEITSVMQQTFFNDVLRKKEDCKRLYKDAIFKGSKTGVQVSFDNGKTYDYVVYFQLLTMSGKIKSNFDVERIYNIDFDEYIPLDGRYLPNEMQYVLEFYKSIDRDRNVVQFNFFGNKIAYFCPFLDYFKLDISLTAKEGIRTYKNNSIAVQIYSNREHREARKQSKFNDAISGTDYESYAYGGVLNDLNLSIVDVSDDCDVVSSFKSVRGEGTIYADTHGNLIVSTKQLKNQLLIVDDVYNNDTREQLKITFGNLATNWKRLYKTNHFYFDSNKAFYLFEPLLAKLR